MKKFYLNENEEAVFKINGKEVTVSKLTVGPTDAEEIIQKVMHFSQIENPVKNLINSIQKI